MKAPASSQELARPDGDLQSHHGHRKSRPLASVAVSLLTVIMKFTPPPWGVEDSPPVIRDNIHRVHPGDRCWREGCNRSYHPGERLA